MLRVLFADNSCKTYDVAPLFQELPVFQSLKAIPGLFDRVTVDKHGYGIVWNEELDLSCDELWEHGTSVLPE